MTKTFDIANERHDFAVLKRKKTSIALCEAGAFWFGNGYAKDPEKVSCWHVEVAGWG